nr:AAA family ATPase [Lachnospiraceae bacterium]
ELSSDDLEEKDCRSEREELTAPDEPENLDAPVAEESEEEKRARELQEAEEAREQFQLVKKRLLDREEAELKIREARLQKLMDELNALVGLQGVKNEIQSLINLIRIRKLREQMKMPLMDMSYHMVFTGAPGTGKTTVARIVARIYRELGILSKETVIETDRSGLVAGYVGQTALKVHDLVEQAVGGVLFIDEAYALVNPDVPNDFGMEAVDTLVKLMEDHRDDLIIIVAGYTEEMKSFLKCNTGLVSRFNKFIDFPDYSDQELLEILDVMAANVGLVIEQDAKEAVGFHLSQMGSEQKEEFGNARGIRNLFEKIVINQANRLITQPHPTREMLVSILKDDIILD